MISRPWVVAVTSVAGALALVWLVRPGSENVTPEPVTAATVAPPERVVAETNVSRPAEPALTPRTAVSTVGRNAEAQVSLAPLPGDTVVSAHSDVPDPAARSRKFEAEPVDTEWAPGAEGELLRKLAEAPRLQVITMRVECRTTMCRLEITQPADAVSDQRAGLMDRSLGLRPTLVIASRDASGAPSTVMYFMRPGHEASSLRR